MRYSIIPVVAAMILTPVFAQHTHGGFGFFSIGMRFLNLDQLNNKLSANGIPTFDPPYISMGGGGFFVGENFLFGGQGEGLIQREYAYQKGDTNFRIRFNGSGGIGMIGYNVIHSPILVQLLGGIGGAGLEIKIVEQRAADFDEILQRPQRELRMEVGTFLLQGGMNILIPLTDCIVLGFQGGYTVSITDSTWKYNSVSIANGPSAGFDGPFFRLLIGFGGFGFDDDDATSDSSD